MFENDGLTPPGFTKRTIDSNFDSAFFVFTADMDGDGDMDVLGTAAYLDNGGTVEKAQTIAAHESPRTTKLYDRTSDDISLDEIERIII